MRPGVNAVALDRFARPLGSFRKMPLVVFRQGLADLKKWPCVRITSSERRRIKLVFYESMPP